MTTKAINADSRHAGIDAASIAATGSTEVYSVIHPGTDMRQWIEDCGKVGVEVIPKVARESLPQWSPDWQWWDYVPFAQGIAASYGQWTTHLAVLNEMDSDGPSSWGMNYRTANIILSAFRAALPHVKLIAPSFCSGDPSRAAWNEDPNTGLDQ